MRRILYLTYDGLTDHLGQSQVLAYLTKLADELTFIDVISFEKKKAFYKNISLVNKAIANKNINWEPIPYTKDPPILSTLKDLWLCWLKTKKLHKKKNYDILHCRGHLLSIIGYAMKKKYGTKFIFDMRAWWADEKIESGHWDGLSFKVVYAYFKKLELILFKDSDFTISLTNAGKDEIVRNGWKESENVRVIPTGVDLDHFKKFDINNRCIIRDQLGFSKDSKVLVYCGSLGGNYTIEELLKVARAFKKVYPKGCVLILSKTEPELFFEFVEQKEVKKLGILLMTLNYEDVPRYLVAGDIGLVIYKKAYSLIGRSPTKLGEYWACGLPVLSLKGVGDLDQLEKKYPFALSLIDETEEDQIVKGLNNLNSVFPKKDLRQVATACFDNSKGVQLYKDLYDSLSLKKGILTEI